MYLESSAVITPDPADPATYSVQDYTGVAVPWADVIRVRDDGGDVIAAAYRHDNGWYAMQPQGEPVTAYYASWDLCVWHQVYTGGNYDEAQALIEHGWA